MDRTAVLETKTEIFRIENIPYFISGYNIYNRRVLQSIVRLLKWKTIEHTLHKANQKASNHYSAADTSLWHFD